MGGELEYVRLVLRITCEEFDPLITNLISAAKDDLMAAGVSCAKLGNAGEEGGPSLVLHAIACYVAANFDRDNQKESDRWMTCYNRLRTLMSISSRYRGGDDEQVG